jgi:hypothetical protein
MPPKPSWYDGIEAPIRPHVRLLRENGFNTTCSCGHGMWVELDLGNNLDDAERLARFLQENGYPQFHLTTELFAHPKSLWIRRAKVHFGDYVPVDDVTAKELTAKIAYFKQEGEKLHQENVKLKEQIKHEAKPEA